MRMVSRILDLDLLLKMKQEELRVLHHGHEQYSIEMWLKPTC